MISIFQIIPPWAVQSSCRHAIDGNLVSFFHYPNISKGNSAKRLSQYSFSTQYLFMLTHHPREGPFCQLIGLTLTFTLLSNHNHWSVMGQETGKMKTLPRDPPDSLTHPPDAGGWVTHLMRYQHLNCVPYVAHSKGDYELVVPLKSIFCEKF